MFVFQLKLHLPAHLIEFIDLTSQMIINVGKFAFAGSHFSQQFGVRRNEVSVY